MLEPRVVVHCPVCGATWELEYEPVACRCDYANPTLPVKPWTWSMQTVEI